MFCSKIQSSSHFVTVPSDNNITHINFILKSYEERDIILQCHNIKEVPSISFGEKIDFDPNL